MNEDIIALHEGNVSTPVGFKAWGVAAGLYPERLDMALLWSSKPATFAGLFTTNTFKAAPLGLTQKLAESGLSQAAIINSGNANAVTGDRGVEDAKAMQLRVAQELGIPQAFVAVASTGVIGVPLPMGAINKGIEALAVQWAESHEEQTDGVNASQAILTTDTIAKTGAATVTLSGGTVKIGMMVKGSGMIHPQMATMLAFFTTDAQVVKSQWDGILSRVVDRSFHRVSVDGDPSTNDMVLAWANGMSGVSLHNGDDAAVFEQALTQLAEKGARMIAQDGEGATHLLTIRVVGAATEADAALKARTAARSSLVKSAVYGRDPNWGRVLAAVGMAGDTFDPNRVNLFMNGLPLVMGGMPQPFQEEEAQALMAEAEVRFVVDLGSGEASAEAWGCDLTEQYVAINAHYRT